MLNQNEKKSYEEVAKEKDIKVPYQSHAPGNEPVPSDTTITKEELERISKLQQNYSQIMIEFGTLKVEKIMTKKAWDSLLDRELQLENQYSELNKEEKLIATELTTKYGQGSIDMDTGKFVKS